MTFSEEEIFELCFHFRRNIEQVADLFSADITIKRSGFEICRKHFVECQYLHDLHMMFAVEKENFCSDQKLDEKWQNLAKTLINENIEEKDELFKTFKESILSNIELVELAQSDLFKDEAFLMR